MRTPPALVVAFFSLLCVAFVCSPLQAEPAAVASKNRATITSADLDAVKAAEAARIAAIDRVYGSVVAIYGNDRAGGGSGVLFDPSGYALTNHHVVAAAGDEGWAGLADKKLYRWKLYGTDPGGDVAIIKLEGRDDFPVAPLADSETVQIGDWAMAMGNPFVLAEDQRPTVTLGIVSGTHRFQPGEGTNTLVYGNCIQVDSSINPGNSGGPLFNLLGQVIGINGRGSFEERGRVNVGLGYAISSNQVRSFIPDLLATKVVQHGTLDAQFGNRTGGVICQTMNLNSPIARLGLELGDRLVSFEGVEITNANQFTNLITTYPAEWPCEVVFERQSVRKTVHVRLTALPYDFKKPMPMPMPPMPPQEKPAEGEPSPNPEGEKTPEEKPADSSEEKPTKLPPPAPEKREIKPVRIVPQGPPMEPGKVRFPDRNAAATAWLLKRLQSISESSTPNNVKAVEQILDDERELGMATTHLAADGRFVVERTLAGEPAITFGFDGKTFWKHEVKLPAESISFEKACREPLVVQAIAMSAMQQGSLSESIGKASLQGGDKAVGKAAYRIAVVQHDEDPIYLWLASPEVGGELPIVLKTGIGLDDDEPVASLVYQNWSREGGVYWPRQKLLVRGLAENTTQRIQTSEVTAPATFDDAIFRIQTP